MITDLKFELTRIFKPNLNRGSLLMLIIISIYAVFCGVQTYNEYQNEKELFLKCEKQIFLQCLNYMGLGMTGIQVLFEPSKANVFFNNNTLFENLHTNLDMSEIVRIDITAKGKKILFRKSNTKSFSNLIFMFATLFMVYMGITGYKNDRHFLKFRNIILRLVILIFLFISLMVFLKIIPDFFGIPIQNQTPLLAYFGYTTLFLSFFYAAGVFIRSIYKKTMTFTIVALFFWLISIFVFPEIVDTIMQKDITLFPANEIATLEKLKRLNDMETEAKKLTKGIENGEEILRILKQYAYLFLKTGYVENTRVEKKINDNVKKISDKIQRVSQFYPTTFYSNLCMEISSKGYQGYLDFVDYTLEQRHLFVQFILNKRYDSKETKIEPFIKNEENIFKAKSQVPKFFWIGFAITAFYTLIFLISSYLILKRRLHCKKETLDPHIPFEGGGEFTFVQCEDPLHMDMIFNHYLEQDDTACIDNVTGEDINMGVNMKRTALYFCKELGANEDLTFQHIENLGIININKEKPSAETVKKIYCAANLAREKKTVVFKDFLNRESRDFEIRLRKQMRLLIDKKINIIYLRTDLPQIETELSAPERVKQFRVFRHIIPQAIILR